MNKEKNDSNTIDNSKRKVTITFRIGIEYDQAIRYEAQDQRVSVNTLANQIFGDYVDWHRYTKKFGVITLSKDAIKLLLESVDEQKLVEVGTKIGEKLPKEFIIFKWKGFSHDNFMNFIKMFISHCISGKYDFSVKEDDDKKTNTISYSLHHELGMKGSLFFAVYLKGMIKSLAGVGIFLLLT